MEIHFCDICNESVPARDLEVGRAFVRRGRVVCATCDGAMSSVSPGEAATPVPAGPADAAAPTRSRPAVEPVPVPPPAAASGRGGALFATALATLALLFAGGVLMTLGARVERLEGESAAAASALRSELDYTVRSLEADVEAARSFALEELDGVQEELAALRSELGDLRSRRAEQGHLNERLDGWSARLEVLERRVGERSDDSLAQLRGRLERLDGELGALADRLRSVEDHAALSVASGERPAPGPPPWHGLLGDLVSENAGARWSAVQSLGETGDSAVVPHLLPSLDDGDIFVRMATARILGDLRAVAAIPELIETLEDGEASVREAALVSLRLLSGRNFRFDPTASEADRRRRVDVWREWWEREGPALLADET